MSERYHIYINGQSGFVLKNGEDAIHALIENSGITFNSLNFLDADTLLPALEQAASSEQKILVGGGDGTIRSVAALALEKGFSFGILPMGTMNLLAKDLSIPLPLEKALKAYKTGATKLFIDAGVINNEFFLCCVGLGIMPEASEYREELRNANAFGILPKLTGFILSRMDSAHFTPMELQFSGKTKRLKTSSLVVSNNRFAHPGESAPLGEGNFKKNSLRDGQLGIYILKTRGWVDKLRFLIKLGLGGWKSDPVMREYMCEALTIRTQKAEELVSLDGEPKTMSTPLKFSIRERALGVLVPNTTEKSA